LPGSYAASVFRPRRSRRRSRSEVPPQIPWSLLSSSERASRELPSRHLWGRQQDGEVGVTYLRHLAHGSIPRSSPCCRSAGASSPCLSATEQNEGRRRKFRAEEEIAPLLVLEGVLETFGLHRAARTHLRASLTLRSTLRSHRGLQKGSVWSSISATPRGDDGTETGRGCYLRWTDPRKRIGPTSDGCRMVADAGNEGRPERMFGPSDLLL